MRGNLFTPLFYSLTKCKMAFCVLFLKNIGFFSKKSAVYVCSTNINCIFARLNLAKCIGKHGGKMTEFSINIIKLGKWTNSATALEWE